MTTYIPFAERHVVNGLTIYNEFLQYRVWLEEHAGAEEVAWRWLRGDMVAQGVYIQDEAVAVVFKLKFAV